MSAVGRHIPINTIMRYTQLFETKLGGFTVKPVHVEQGNMDEADLNRRGFLKGVGTAAVAGAAGGAKAHTKEIYQKVASICYLYLACKGPYQRALNQGHNVVVPPEVCQKTNQLIQKFIKVFPGGKDLINSTYANVYTLVQEDESREPFKGSVLNRIYFDKAFQQRLLNDFESLIEFNESVKQGVAEAIKLDAPQKSWSRQDMQAYLTRIKTGTKTKQDRFKPIIHGSNVKAMVKDDGTEEWDLEDLKRQITTPPRAILGSNAKMSKSKKEGAITYDLTLPALSGIVVDEETGEFVEITTCPGAGECQLFCYARKGGYVMFPAASMSAAQALNFLVNHPDEYMQMFDTEIKRTKALADKNGIKLLVRIHDAGDFFSKEYWDLSKRVQLNNPDVRFYFYSKMGDPVTDPTTPANTLPNFSDGGAKSREVKKVEFHRNAGKNLKGAPTIPKDMFRNLFVTDAKGKYVKDEQGRTQVRSAEAWDEFRQQLSAKYRIDPESIITYDQMNRIPEGPKPQWNVVVFPAGHGDLGATRLDVQNQFLMFH